MFLTDNNPNIAFYVGRSPIYAPALILASDHPKWPFNLPRGLVMTPPYNGSRKGIREKHSES